MTNDIQVILFVFVNYHSFAHTQSEQHGNKKPVLKKKFYGWKRKQLMIAHIIWYVTCCCCLDFMCVWICHCCCCFLCTCRWWVNVEWDFFCARSLFAINFMHLLSHSCCCCCLNAHFHAYVILIFYDYDYLQVCTSGDSKNCKFSHIFNFFHHPQLIG